MQTPSTRYYLALILAASLAVLSACGGKKSMEAGGEDEGELGQVAEAEPTPVMSSEEDGSLPDKVSARPKGDTSSGPGRPNKLKVRSGDSLWKIAARPDVYGSGWLYPLIYNANKDRIRDPQHLEAGIELKIPRDISDEAAEVAKEQAMTGQIFDAPLAEEKAVVLAPKAVAPKKRSGILWLLVLLLAGAGALTAVWLRKRGVNATVEENA